VTNIGSGQHAVWLAASPVSLATLYDNWVSAYFGTNAGNAAIAGQAADPDLDGRSNYSEFMAATDPLDVSSLFRIDSVARPSATQPVSVTVQGHAGRQYFLEAATQPGAGWGLVASSGVLATNQVLVLQDNPTGINQRLYRVRVSP
jgi:hypothetical protein